MQAPYMAQHVMPEERVPPVAIRSKWEHTDLLPQNQQPYGSREFPSDEFNGDFWEDLPDLE
jgi:hypothetical protein